MIVPKATVRELLRAPQDERLERLGKNYQRDFAIALML